MKKILLIFLGYLLLGHSSLYAICPQKTTFATQAAKPLSNHFSLHDMHPAQQQDSVTDEPNSIRKIAQQLRISGYIQAQYQWGQENASLYVGNKNENPDQSFNRIGIRRGRLKFSYEEKIVSGVFQLNINENGIDFKDLYINLTDPWIKTCGLTAGVFEQPFGIEIALSSSAREYPESSTVIRTLFPDERDIGAMVYLQPKESSPLHFIRLNAALFSGNGINRDTDSRKDFSGRLSANKQIFNNLHLSGGFSYYHGSVYQGTENVYKMKGNTFILNNDADNNGAFAKRQYFGFDAQFRLRNCYGTTTIRAEYLFGQQPGEKLRSKSPDASELPETDIYIRHFNGGYILFIQDIGQTPLQAVVKYDRYDPNTKIKEDEIGQNNTGSADIALQTFGIGLTWNVIKNLNLQTFYEFNDNEKSRHLSGYENNRKDDLFTMRLQYKF